MEEILKEKRHLYQALTLLSLLTAFFIVVAAIGGISVVQKIGKSAIGENIISVTGQAEVFAVPDIATINFSVHVEGDTVDVAQVEAAKITNASIAYLESQDIDEKDIKTTNYSVNPRYEYRREGICNGRTCPPGGERVLTGYEVNQSVTTKIRDTEIVGKILGGIGELGVTNINGPFFEIDDEESLEVEARTKAIENAREKANELAKSLDVRLGKVVSFNESGSYPIYPYGGDFAIERAAVSAPKGIPEIPTGENIIRSSVTIIYEIK
jgi:uncharacterized protein